MTNMAIQARKIRRAGTNVEMRPDREGVAALELEPTFGSSLALVLT
jgi:hypothetical protein